MAFQDSTKGFSQNTDFAADFESVARRKRLLDALQQQSLSSPIVGHTGGFQALAKIATAAINQYGQDRALKEQKELETGRQSDLARAMETYMTTREGKPGEVMSDAQASALMSQDVAPNLAEPVKGNPRRATIEALTNQHPEMKMLGQLDMQAMAKKKDAKYVYHQMQDGSLVATREDDPNFKQTVGNYAKPQDQWSEPYTIQGPSGPLLVKKNIRTGDIEPIDKTPKIVNNNNVGTGEKAADKGLGEALPKVLEKVRADYISNQQTIQTADRIANLASSPDIITGFGADKIKTIASLGAKLGFNGPEAVAQTQTLITELARNTLAAGQDLKGSASDKDILFLKEVAGGNIELTPQAMVRIAGIAKAAASNSLLNNMQQYNSSAAAYGPEVEARGKAMFPMPPLQPYEMPPDQFKEGERGRVQYIGGGVAGPQPGQAPAGGGGFKILRRLR